MRPWKFCLILTLALGFGALGCGGGGTPATALTIAISPTTASVITNTTQPFSAFVTGSTDQAATWTVTCPTGVTAPACGTIDTNGVYSAPKTVPPPGHDYSRYQLAYPPTRRNCRHDRALHFRGKRQQPGMRQFCRGQ